MVCDKLNGAEKMCSALFLIQRLDETARLDLPQQAVVDEGFWIGGLGFRIIFFDESQHRFDG